MNLLTEADLFFLIIIQNVQTRVLTIPWCSKKQNHRTKNKNHSFRHKTYHGTITAVDPLNISQLHNGEEQKTVETNELRSTSEQSEQQKTKKQRTSAKSGAVVTPEGVGGTQ